MAIYVSVNLSYSDIYPDYDQINIDELTQDIPTIDALILISHYTAMIHTRETSNQLQAEIIRQWYGRFPNNVKQAIERSIYRDTTRLSNFNYINNVSSVLTIQYLLSRNNHQYPKQLTSVQEENLFKTYLYFSSQWTNEQQQFQEKHKDYEAPAFIMPFMIRYNDLFEFKDFRLQFIKAIYFFQFCEGNEEFARYYSDFLKDRQLQNWNEYLVNIMSVYVHCLQDGNVRSVMSFPEDAQQVFNSLLHYCINDTKVMIDADFKDLRTKPLYNLGDNELLLYQLNFFIDKLYHSVIFDFGASLVRQETKQNGKGKTIGSVLQFMGIYGDRFAEQGLLYKVLEQAFPGKKLVRFSGDELKDKLGKGTPDYIIRDKHKLFVFEFKNLVFASVAKQAYDYDAIQQEVFRKLVANDEGSPKGVTQLANTIDDIRKGRYDTIDQLPYNDLIIYPIIITTDFLFNTHGINRMIEPVFTKLLEERDLDAEKIKAVTLVDIDLLIKFQDFFIDHKLTLHHCLDDYRKYLIKGDGKIEKSLSFYKYMHDKTRNKPYETPRIFLEFARLILPVS